MRAVEAVVAGRRLTLTYSRAVESVGSPAWQSPLSRWAWAHSRGGEPLTGAQRSANHRGRLVRPEGESELASTACSGAARSPSWTWRFRPVNKVRRRSGKRFLQRLPEVPPKVECPIVVTDAGFRAPWFRAVEAMGWHGLGRLRDRNYLRPCNAAQGPCEWVPCRLRNADVIRLITARGRR